jgi:hypothetical protein
MMQSEDKFVLVWKQGSNVVDSIEVPRREGGAGSSSVVRYDELAAKIADEWRSKGQHTSASDVALDQAVLHTDNRTEFKYIVAVMDAIYATKRTRVAGAKAESVPAFNLTFSTSS